MVFKDTFFAGSYDGRITAFDAAGQATRFEDNSGHGCQITGMATSGDRLYSVGFDDRAREIDPSQRAFTYAILTLRRCGIQDANDNPASSMAVPLTSQPKGVAAFASGSNTVFVISANGVEVIKDGQPIFNLPVNYQPSAVAITQDGTLVAVGGQVRDCTRDPARIIRLSFFLYGRIKWFICTSGMVAS